MLLREPLESPTIYRLQQSPEPTLPHLPLYTVMSTTQQDEEGLVQCPLCPRKLKNLSRHLTSCQKKQSEQLEDEEFRKREQAEPSHRSKKAGSATPTAQPPTASKSKTSERRPAPETSQTPHAVPGQARGSGKLGAAGASRANAGATGRVGGAQAPSGGRAAPSTPVTPTPGARPASAADPERSTREPRAPMGDDIRTEYHPNAGRARRHDAFEEYRRQHRSKPLSPEKKHDPWYPFESRADFEFSELALKCCLNQSQITAFLDIIQRCVEGEDTLHFKDYSDLSRTWNAASHLLTPMERHKVTVELKGEEKEHNFWCRSLWDWAADLIKDPTLAPFFEWDAQKLFKFDSEKEEWVRFVNEPWTGDRFYKVQSTLPTVTLPNGKVVDGKPLGFTLYADKTQMSTFGGQLAHPVYAAVANLPVSLRNGGEGKLGGSRIVGWLPIIQDSDQGECSDKEFADYKRVVWHGCLGKLFESILEKGMKGCWIKCGDGVERWLFPFILILSADYEEQCTMANTRGFQGLCPCPICLVPSDRIVDLTVSFPTRDLVETENLVIQAKKIKAVGKRDQYLKAQSLRPVRSAFATIANSDPFEALSFDRLHSYHNGLGGKHLWGQVLAHIKARYGENSAQMRAMERRAREFPRWNGLTHFTKVLSTKFQDGLKNQDLMKICLFLTFNLFTSNDKIGRQLLKVVRCFINLDTLAGFDNHTEETIKMITDELAIFEVELKAYIALDPENNKNWNFPKMHMQVHLAHDIWLKGATKNTNTKVFESMHRLLKAFYLYMTNFKNFDGRVLELDHWAFTATYIRNLIEASENKGDLFDEDQEDPAPHLPRQEHNLEEEGSQVVDASPAPTQTFSHQIPVAQLKKRRAEAPMEFGHITFGSAQKAVPAMEFCTSRQNDPRFNNFIASLDKYLADNTNGIDRMSSDTKIHEYYYFKTLYESKVSWEAEIDRLRCNPSFSGSSRYDAVMINNGVGSLPSFGRLGALFTVEHPLLPSPIPLAFVEICDRPIPDVLRKKDRNLGLFRIRTRPRSAYTIIQAATIIRGALLVPVFDEKDAGYFVFDVADGDIFLRVREMWNTVELEAED
ncbi:hypothetical protein DFP72DRAFT_1033140 [Ephemerocybe angulata]|uniref:Uncharacterized protein n=1 Tax=Ephemerocybe angulata TaxID=980116 RepID=A0A8H6HXQ4_9AGAR|nr:hypothetical protein DFP72DRAFT_1033140 [Tulosesus angulatus]